MSPIVLIHCLVCQAAIACVFRILRQPINSSMLPICGIAVRVQNDQINAIERQIDPWDSSLRPRRAEKRSHY
jgi:hypothetical protein